MSKLIDTHCLAAPHAVVSHRPAASQPWSWRPPIPVALLGVGLALGAAVLVRWQGSEPDPACVLFLYQTELVPDPSELVESAAADLGGQVAIELNGRRLASATAAGFSCPFVPARGVNAMKLQGFISSPLFVKVVQLGPPDAGNVVVFRKQVSRDEMADGVEATFVPARFPARKEGP